MPGRERPPRSRGRSNESLRGGGNDLRVADDPRNVMLKAWFVDHVGQPGDALERLLDRRVRDHLLARLPVELARPEWAA